MSENVEIKTNIDPHDAIYFLMHAVRKAGGTVKMESGWMREVPDMVVLIAVCGDDDTVTLTTEEEK